MKYVTLAAIALLFSTAGYAQGDSKRTLFVNCNVLDGVAENLAQGRNILVEGNPIAVIGDTSLSVEDAALIDCDGRTVMPGLIDAHTHLYMNMPGGVGGSVCGDCGRIAFFTSVLLHELAHLMVAIRSGIQTSGQLSREIIDRCFALDRPVQEEDRLECWA